ncbi:MAG: Gfo/Idh/MocA family oxidoreductase [bacterium]
MEIQKKHIGLIGLGYWGKNLLRNLYELGVLHSACDLNEYVIKECERKYSDINYTASFDNIFKKPEIKAIAIATPAVTHYELVKKAIANDKDVFVEKPLALTVREGEELVYLAREKNKILMVGHILQYHPAVVKLKEMISSGELGKIRYVYSNRLNIGKLRTEENILWSFAPHDISMILMLLGEDPVEVSAFGGDYLNQGINDITLTTLNFKNGIKGHIFVSWLHPYKEQKLIVVGSTGMAVFDDVTKEKLFLYPHQIKWENGKIPVAQKADFHVIPFSAGEPLKLELQHFYDCVQSRNTPKTDGTEGLKVLKVLEAAEESLIKKTSISIQSGNLPQGVFIHKTACIDDNVILGEGTKIWHFSHVLKNSKIGKDCIIGQNVTIGPDAVVGNKCKIQNNVSVYKGVVLEDEVFCGPSCVFTNVYNPRAFIERKNEFRNTLIKKGATIGANATIVCGVTVGSYSMTGAGAVVKKDVPDYAVVTGIPAKQTGWVCKCGVTFKDCKKTSLVCKSCGSKYKVKKGNFLVIEEKI